MSEFRSPQKKLIIVMGVSGCGKSTVAKAIAEKLAYRFIEADDYHSEKNRQHMAQGKPLSNAMREPWIQSLCDDLTIATSQSRNCVMAFSGLQAQHRAKFDQLNFKRITLFLDGNPTLIQQRIEKRTSHYMPSSLLASQYKALQNPELETNTFKIDISANIDEVIEHALKIIQLT